MISPIFEKLSESTSGEIDFYKVDVDEQADISQEVGIRAVRNILLLSLLESAALFSY